MQSTSLSVLITIILLVGAAANDALFDLNYYDSVGSSEGRRKGGERLRGEEGRQGGRERKGGEVGKKNMGGYSGGGER